MKCYCGAHCSQGNYGVNDPGVTHVGVSGFGFHCGCWCHSATPADREILTQIEQLRMLVSKLISEKPDGP